MSRSKRKPAADAPQPAGAAAASTPTWMERRFWLILAGILVLSFLCRVAILREYVATNPLAGVPINDAKAYWDWAGRIADGEFTQDAPFFSAPLYPYLLGLLRTLGGGLTTTYAIQILFDGITAVLLAITCRGRFGAGAGLLAAALFLLLLEPASSALRILASSEQLLIVTGVWAALVAAQSKASIGRLLVVGVLIGLLCLAYAPALLFIGLIPVWLFVDGQRQMARVGRCVLPAVVAAVVMAPAAWHNWCASGELFLIRAGGGVTLRQGNHPTSIGVYTQLPGISTNRELMHADAAGQVRDAIGQDPSWKEVDRYFRGEVLQYWRADPGRAFQLAAKKLYLFLSARNYADIYQPREEVKAGVSGWLWLTPLPTPWLLWPALVGLFLMLRRPPRHAPQWMLFAVPLLIVVVFFYSPRYRIPAVPIIVVGAAWAFHQAVQWRTHWRTTTAVTVALLIGILLGAVNGAAGVDQSSAASLAFHLGHAHRQQEDLEAALHELRRGLRMQPNDPDALTMLGDVLNDLDRPAEALGPFMQAATIRPDDLALRRRVGMTLFAVKRFAEAERALSQLAQEQPDDAGVIRALAGAKQMQGQRAEAAGLFERALELDPEHTSTRFVYAELLLRLQRWDAAQQALTRVVEEDPENFDALYNLALLCSRHEDWSAARSYFEEALTVKPRNVETLHALAMLDFQEGQFDAAEQRLRAALAIDPNHEGCRRSLRRVQQARAGGQGTSP